MSGVLWAAVAGILFGVFQSVNRLALVELDVMASTFIQMLACTAFLGVALLVQGTEHLGSLTAGSVAMFSIAGVIHFLGGWTLLNASQKRIGAARTSPLLATAPLFGTVIAAVTLDELPDAVELVGVVLIVAGVYVTQLDRLRAARVPAAVGTGGSGSTASTAPPLRASLFGLGTALAWAVSPVFIREGLEDVDDPILGVTIAVLASTFAFAIVLLVRGGPVFASASRRSLTWKLAGGLLVGIGTWARWYALSLEPVAVVLGLGLLTVPTVMLLAPVIVGRALEPVTTTVLLGAALVVVGALILIVRG
jgi:drug/metabolite transporter (DMT)-like permease